MNKHNTKTLRMITMAAAAIIIIVGAISNTGTGSFSAFGSKDIYAICPLGYLEATLASREFLPHLFIAFLIVTGITVLLGRAFCGWLCPIPLVRKLLNNKLDEVQQTVSNSSADNNSSPGLVILGVTLGSSALFGFPVFCLICPLGLVFATLFALIRLFHFNEPTLDILVFPIIIIVELIVLKKWCSKLCPVGALLSVFSRFNRTLVPVINRSRCLEESHNTKCQLCRSVCSFDVDLKNSNGTGNISDCSKCRECADNCPTQAIRFPWR